MYKSILSVFVVLSMVLTLVGIPTTVSAANTSEYFWIEAENYDAASSSIENYVVSQSESFSGGKLISLNRSVYNTSAENKLVYKFNASEAGEFDLFFLTSDGLSQWFCPYQWKVNDGISSLATYTASNPVHTSIEDQSSFWQKAGSSSVNAGENTLTITCPNAPYFHIIDAIVIVPKSWSWNPAATITTRPIQTRTGTVIIEAENYDVASSSTGNYEVGPGSTFSGGKLLFLKQSGYNSSIENKLVYNFNSELSGDFDLFLLTTDGRQPWFSQYNWKINNGEFALAEAAGGTANVYTSVQGNPSIWQKAGSSIVNKGANTVTIACPNAPYFHIIDTIILVPKSYSWTPEANIATRPEAVKVGPVWIEAENYDVANSSADNYVVGPGTTFSGGKLLFLNRTGYDELKENKLVYTFETAADDDYDIFMLTTDGRVQWYSQYKWKINNGEFSLAEAGGSTSVYTSVEGQPSIWQKAGNSSISKGWNTLTVACPDLPRFHIIDAIVIVPKTWKWTPEATIATRPVIPGDSLVITDKQILDVNGNKLLALSDTASAKGRVKFINYGEADQDVLCLSSMYQGNQLVEVKTNIVRIPRKSSYAYNTETFYINKSINAENKIKLFVWNSDIQKMHPITSAFEVTDSYMTTEFGFDFDTAMVPFWKSKVAYNESVMMVSETNSKADAKAALLNTPLKILSVKDSYLQKEYVEGVDWVYIDGKLKLLETSTAPYMTREQLFPIDAPEEGLSIWTNTKDAQHPIAWAEGSYWHDRQLAVTYTHNDTFIGNTTNYVGDTGKALENTATKLIAGQPLNVVLYGDSIANKSNTSGMLGKEPYMPSWGELFVKNLQKNYTSTITYNNQSVSGTMSSWGLDNVATKVTPLNPDLVIIAFGMNDGNSYIDNATFKSNITGIIANIRANNANAEFVLVSTILANPLVTFDATQANYASVLNEIADNYIGVAVADMTSIHSSLLTRKAYIDMTGNNINHTNDYLARWYAQMLSALLIK